MKLKFVIVEPSVQVSSVIEKNLVDHFGAEVVCFSNASDTLEYLDSGEHVSLIISRNKSDDENTASICLNFLYDHTVKIPLIVIGEFEHTYKQYALVSGRTRVEEINRLILKALNLKKEDFAFLKLPDFLPYPIEYFYLMSFTPCDVYIKLTKKGETEYVKRFHEAEEFELSDLKKYEDHGLKEFYILKDDNSILMDALLIQTFKEVKESTNDEETIEILSTTFNISTDMMRKVGITAEARALADQTILNITQQVLKNDKLGLLLRKILDDKMSLSYRRSYMISLLAATLLPRLEWGGAEQIPNIVQKISMVSFYHDIYLEEEHLLKIMSNNDLKNAEKNINKLEKELVLNHANKAAFLLQSYPKLPSGVDLIVKQHHGMSNGVGFPEHFSSAISPLAVLFLILEDFTHQLLISIPNIDMPAIHKNLKEKYPLPSYRKITNELAIIGGTKKSN